MICNTLLGKSINWSLSILLSFIFVGGHVQAQTASISSDWQPNGSLIAYVAGGKLTLFDTISAQHLDILPTLPDSLFTAVWSPDGTRLAASDTKGAVYVWRIPADHSTGELLTVLRDFENTVTSLAWSATGEWLAGSSWDSAYTVQVWDMDTFQSIFQARGNTYNVSWSPVGNVLAVSNIGGAYLVDFDQIKTSLPVSFATFSELATVATQIISGEAAVPITWSSDGAKVATGSFDGTIRVFDVVNMTEVVAIENTDIVTTLDWSPDGAYLAGAVRDGAVLVWETNTYQTVATFLRDANISMLSFSPFGGRLVFGNISPADVQTSLANGAVQIVVPAPSLERLQAIADACNAPADVERVLPASAAAGQLAEFVAQVEALPENTIPPACAADLIAVAEALQSR